MLTRLRRRPLHSARRTTETRRRPWLHDSIYLDECAARLVMRVFWRLSQTQYRSKAYVRTFHLFAPLGSCLCFENCGNTLLHFRPMRAVCLRRQIGQVEAECLDQHGVELRLIRTDTNMLPVLSLVDIIVMAATIETVHPTLIQVVSRRICTIAARHKRRCAINHRCIDHLAFARFHRFEKCTDHAEGEIHTTAAKISYKVQGW